MKIGRIDIEEQPLVIAEIGNNHEGNLDLAVRLIELAAAAGADAVKFQTIRAEKLVRRSDDARFQRLKKFELSFAAFEQLADRAAQCGVMFLSTPFDLESARFINDLCPAIKIASGDNNFLPLLETVAQYGKPILLSTGAADIQRVQNAKSVVEQHWPAAVGSPAIVLLHCVCAYPTPPQDANLAAIQTLRQTFNCPVGYSDHTLGIEAAVLSIALGAQVIEKHFTIDKAYSDFRDHQLSADPDEMRQLVIRIREARSLLGDGIKRLQSSEVATAVALQRRIVAGADLAPGTVIEWEHLNWVRSPEGLAAGTESLILGRMLKEQVKKGDPLIPSSCH